MEGITKGEHVQRRQRPNTMVFSKLVGKEILLMLSLGILVVSFSHMLEFFTGVQKPIVVMHSDVKEWNITPGDALFIHLKNAAINVHGPKRPSFRRVIGCTIISHPRARGFSHKETPMWHGPFTLIITNCGFNNTTSSTACFGLYLMWATFWILRLEGPHFILFGDCECRGCQLSHTLENKNGSSCFGNINMKIPVQQPLD